MKNKGFLGLALLLLSIIMVSGGTFSSLSTYSLSDAFVVNASNGYAYVLGHNYGDILALSLSNMDSPAYAGQLRLNANPRACCIEGDYMYVYGGNGIRIIDISDPANMSVVYSDGTTSGEDIAVSNDFVYTLGYNCITVYDVSVPESAYIAATFNCIHSDNYGIAIQDTIIYVSSYSGVYLYDLASDCSTITFISQISSYSPFGIAVDGDYVYTTEGWSGLAIFDVSVPSLPTLVSTVSAGGWSYEVFYRNDIVYIASEQYLNAINVSDRNNPIISGYYSMPSGYCYDVFGYGADIFIAEYMSGLRTLTYSDDAMSREVMSKDKVKENNIATKCDVDVDEKSVTISLTAHESGYLTLNLYDQTGRTLKTLYKGDIEKGSKKMSLNRANIERGIYFIQGTLSKDKINKKFIVY